jgi:hypothetical protein
VEQELRCWCLDVNVGHKRHLRTRCSTRCHLSCGIAKHATTWLFAYFSRPSEFITLFRIEHSSLPSIARSRNQGLHGSTKRRWRERFFVHISISPKKVHSPSLPLQRRTSSTLKHRCTGMVFHSPVHIKIPDGNCFCNRHAAVSTRSFPSTIWKRRRLNVVLYSLYLEEDDEADISQVSCVLTFAGGDLTSLWKEDITYQ